LLSLPGQLAYSLVPEVRIAVNFAFNDRVWYVVALPEPDTGYAGDRSQ
jgi:hypothetical protein